MERRREAGRYIDRGRRREINKWGERQRERDGCRALLLLYQITGGVQSQQGLQHWTAADY